MIASPCCGFPTLNPLTSILPWRVPSVSPSVPVSLSRAIPEEPLATVANAGVHWNGLLPVSAGATTSLHAVASKAAAKRAEKFVVAVLVRINPPAARGRQGSDQDQQEW